jgi:cytochrome c556
MIIGVIAFYFATGALGNILVNIDSSDDRSKNFKDTLESIGDLPKMIKLIQPFNVQE